MHPVDAIAEFCMKGFNQPLLNGMNPVAVCTVGEDFIASNFPQSEGIRDDTFNIRTNYNIMTKFVNYFPLRESECVYTKYITVIRDHNLNPITDQQYLYRFSLITIAPINKPKLLDENKMRSTEYLKTMTIIETIFQTAISGGNNILVLSAFGNTEDDVPQEDIVKIYNACIYKYGHRFLKIVIAIPIWYGTYIYDLFNNDIIRPQFFEEESVQGSDREVKKVINKKKKDKNDYSKKTSRDN
jgi:hypothetical protein